MKKAVSRIADGLAKTGGSWTDRPEGGMACPETIGPGGEVRQGLPMTDSTSESVAVDMLAGLSNPLRDIPQAKREDES
tara:strand:+ start:10137 stop:10370 length:234 start_codon:yes stop_codon:yes gene_type:complete